MIEVTHLVKKYGKHIAVNDISFSVKEGEILGFLGPNGAGKSTTMNMMTGYLSSTSGSIKINGIDILENPIEAKKNIGYLPEIPPLYMDMTIEDYLIFVAKLKKVKKTELKVHIEEILKRAEIEHVRNRLIKNLSKGYKQRVGLACALIGNPKLLILDEPTVGLDPKQIIEMRALIKELSKKHTIILSSHILPEISAICDKIMIINKGNMVALDSPENLQHLFTQNVRTVLRLRSIDEAFTTALSQIEGVVQVKVLETVEENTTELAVDANQGMDVREAIFKLCSETNHPLLMMQSETISLEDIFLKATMSMENTATLENTPETTTSLDSLTAEKQNSKEGVKDEEYTI
ncbi:MAG: ABC transporter ATP-binding protein [Cellulosilyticum sp.]|nr:ABC transporter ATP-binding protein [Cellulosilyticum sp.]